MASQIKHSNTNDLLQVMEIQTGFESGNVLVWNGKEFKSYSKKEAKNLVAPAYEKTLEKVSERVINFFNDHTDICKVETLEKIEKRLSPYKGWYGWLLKVCFKRKEVESIVQKFESLIGHLKGMPLTQQTQKALATTSAVEGSQARVPSLAAAQLAAPLREIPLTGIKMGLPNPNNSCWFNSVLKFLAATNVYDAGFNQNDSDLSQNFRLAINELRSGGSGVMDGRILNRLTTIVTQQFPRFSLSRQHDSDEFIRSLMHKIWPDSGNSLRTSEEVARQGTTPFFSECANEYRDSAAAVPDYIAATKAPTSDGYKGVVVLRASIEDVTATTPIELNELLSRESELLVQGDDRSDHEFQRRLRFTHLPDQLVINFQRAVQNEETRQIGVCRRPIMLNSQGEVVLALYRQEGEALIKVGDVRYKVEAAIKYFGRGVSGGHYVCEVCNPDGTHTYHGDESVRSIGAPIGAEASILYLRKVPI